MGFSKDPVKRRRQLEALARNNPKMDVDALLADHEARETAQRAAPLSVPALPSDQEPAVAGGAGLLEIRATDADLVSDENGDFTLIFWAAGADPEHPTLGLAITEDAAVGLERALEAHLGVGEDDAPESPAADSIELESLRLVDLDRPRTASGEITGPWGAGQVEIVLRAADGLELTAVLTEEQTETLGRWLRPKLFDVPQGELDLRLSGRAAGTEPDHAAAPEAA